MPTTDFQKQILSAVEAEFEAVNTTIFQQLSSNIPLVETIGHYIIDSGGKRLRPLLALLSARALNYQGQQHINLATIIEFLHTATLLHDDVVDTSDMRRGKATANAEWGNAPSVLVGDFLYSRAFQMMVSLADMDIMKILSDTTNVIAEGEVQQLINCNDPDVTEDNYMTVIRSKTAVLFAASSECGAIIAGASPSQVEAMKNYGLHIGVAFQLVDDLLDYCGNADEMGKNVGDDLAEGKPTLPLIYTMAHGSPDQQQLIRQAIEHGGLENIEAITKAVQGSGALDFTAQKAKQEALQAVDCLSELPESNIKDAMRVLADFAIARTH